MEEFVQSYYVSQMNLYATQISNQFRYSKSALEKDISHTMTHLSSDNFDPQNDLKSLKESILKAKVHFLEMLEQNKPKLQLIRQTGENLKAFLKMNKEEKAVLSQRIFFVFLFEYLFKFEMKSTISFLKNFETNSSLLSDYGLEKYHNFREIAADLELNKPARLIDWCRCNRSKLKKLKCNLEFRVQAKILSEQSQIFTQNETLEFIQTKIAPLASENEEIFSVLKYLLSEEKIEIPESLAWQNITSDFCKFYFEIEGFNKNYFLENIVQVILSDWNQSAED